MGLFSKKPKPSANTSDDAAASMPAPTTAPSPAPAPAPAPRSGKKAKKGAIDPVDVLNLRAELMDVKARLMAAEQSRSIVESRLAALDATALALSSDQAGTSGAAERLADLEAQVAGLASRSSHSADGASAPMEDAEAREMAAALQARLDELVGTLDAKRGDHELLEKLATLDIPPAVDPELQAKVDALGLRLHELDDLAERVAQIDVLTGQLSQLNARVTAQAEFGAQLSAMRDRITELQVGATDAATDTASTTAPAADDSELREQVAGLTNRLAATEALAAQLGALAERVATTDATSRQTAEQVVALEQRVNSVGTELANQISELGRDIDGLAERTADVAAGTVSDEVMAALRSGQIKLANEQARYEIAFREDLAALAEHVRRQPRT